MRVGRGPVAAPLTHGQDVRGLLCRYAGTMQQFRYRLATVDDVAVITDIYNEAVMAGGSTADTVPVTYEARRRWIESHVDPYAVFVFETIAGDGEAEEVGFGAISVFYDRPGYDGVCDLAYYVTARWQRRGVGRFALRTLLNECRARAMRKACAIIFSDNTASNALVESFGFEPFGEMPEAAYDSRGVLHDMSYWCLDLTPLDAKGAVEGIARR